MNGGNANGLRVGLLQKQVNSIKAQHTCKLGNLLCRQTLHYHTGITLLGN